MSKELIERLITVCEAMEAGVEDWPIASHIWEYRQAIARIEELERERDGWKASAENRLEIQRQREERIAALQADNARLREALENIEMCGNRVSHEIATIALSKVRKP